MKNFNTSISVVLPVGHRQRLEELVREKANQTMKSESLCSLVRHALEEVYDLGDDQGEDVLNLTDGGTQNENKN